jgi:1-acyl-sn-glycerol-3-phosphate acyltransferase
MLDLARLQRINLSQRPWVQRVCWRLLQFDWWRPPHTEIIVEGIENIPSKPVFIAMNHTDRYNYFPFQSRLLEAGLPHTATWVKGKYYENPLTAWFMDAANNIPLPSRGYVISATLKQGLGRKPTEPEYRLVRQLVEGLPVGDDLPSDDLRRWFDEGGGATATADRLRGTFAAMMVEVMRIAPDHILVFPEGTRRLRLGRGHIGLAQVAQHLGAPILPVACNGSSRVYPGNLPISRGGRIVYRVGTPLPVDHKDLLPHRVLEPFTPFTAEAEARHGQAFRAITDRVMVAIGEMLDADHLPLPEGDDDGTKGVDRFL